MGEIQTDWNREMWESALPFPYAGGSESVVVHVVGGRRYDWDDVSDEEGRTEVTPEKWGDYVYWNHENWKKNQKNKASDSVYSLKKPEVTPAKWGQYVSNEDWHENVQWFVILAY